MGRTLPAVLLALVAACGGAEPDAGSRSDDPPDVTAERPGGPEGGAAADAAPGLRIRDAEGREVVLGATPPSRIVSLVPSATRTLTALRAADLLVGRTDFDTAAALADLPSVGRGLGPSGEVLLSLEPELVIRFAGESDRDTPALLDRAGIAHVAVRPERIGEVREMVRTLGRITGREAVADSILGAQRRVLDSIRGRTANLEPVSAAFTLGGDPPYVAGPSTFVGELIVLAGGRNVFGDLDSPWAGVSPETILARDPDVLLTLRGTELDPRLTRGRDVRRVPPVVQLPGPDLQQAALAIARALRPGLFEPPAPAGAP